MILTSLSNREMIVHAENTPGNSEVQDELLRRLIAIVADREYYATTQHEPCDECGRGY